MCCLFQVQIALKNVDEWDFDILSMESVSKSKLVYERKYEDGVIMALKSLLT